jgi:hypothetical protein
VRLYKVIFLGLAVAGPEEEARLVKGLQGKFKLAPEKAESLLQRVPIVVKRGVSKEEMERYAKAFEEIGGRVRVEEEAAEPLGISEESEPKRRPEPKPRIEPSFPREPEKKPYTGDMITCPQCGFEQPETDECIKCGIIISKYIQYQEMDRSYEGKIREISSEEKHSPWEGEEGFVGAFFKTIQEVLFSPTKFFKKVATGKGYWSPFIFGMILGIIGFGVVLLWQWLFFSGMVPPQIYSLIPYGLFVTFIIILIPVTIGISIFVGSGVTHLCLMIVGGNRKGFETTFRAISYSYSAQLFYIVPIIGNLIGGIYLLILIVIGVREGHDISTGKAVLAVLLPLIVGVGLGIIAALLIPMFFGSMGFFGGVRV